MINTDDILSQFEKEIGHKLSESRTYKFEDYAFWAIKRLAELQSKVNGVDLENETALHKQNVVFSETVCKYKDSCGHDLCNLTECDEFEEKQSEAEVCKCLQCYPIVTADGYLAKKCINCGIEHLQT